MLEVRDSSIHGQGVFATRQILAGESIPNDRPGLRAWGDTINHADDPNVYLNDDETLTVLKTIQAGQELTMDYRTLTHFPGTEIHWER